MVREPGRVTYMPPSSGSKYVMGSMLMKSLGLLKKDDTLYKITDNIINVLRVRITIYHVHCFVIHVSDQLIFCRMAAGGTETALSAAEAATTENQTPAEEPWCAGSMERYKARVW